MLHGLQGIAGDEQTISLTLFTDVYVVRGTIRTRQRRITDILNQAEHDFLVLTDTVMDEYGSRAVAVKSEYAQINLGAVLFAVADTAVDAVPELRTPKVPEQAMISIPPFKVVGRIHLLPERNLGQALEELTGRFLPVTDALFWSETVGEARTTSPMLAVNHARAHILAPHREVDPWEGLQRGSEGGAEGGVVAGAGVAGAAGGAGAAAGAPVQDPWGTGRSEPATGPATEPVQDPWGLGRTAETPAETAPDAGNPWGGPGGDPWGTGLPKKDDELIG